MEALEKEVKLKPYRVTVRYKNGSKTIYKNVTEVSTTDKFLFINHSVIEEVPYSRESDYLLPSDRVIQLDEIAEYLVDYGKIKVK